MTEAASKIETGFIVAVDFESGGKTVTNYLEGDAFGFRSWSSRCDRAKRFDTRALARRAAKGAPGRLRILAAQQCAAA